MSDAVQMTSVLDACAFAASPSGMLACGTLCSALAVDGTTVWLGRVTSIDEIGARRLRTRSRRFPSD